MTERPAPRGFFPLVYAELRRLAAARLAGEPTDNTLDATDLVHEAYLRLEDTAFADQSGDGRVLIHSVPRAGLRSGRAGLAPGQSR
jgi:hypothetical protein